MAKDNCKPDSPKTNIIIPNIVTPNILNPSSGGGFNIKPSKNQNNGGGGGGGGGNNGGGGGGGGNNGGGGGGGGNNGGGGGGNNGGGGGGNNGGGDNKPCDPKIFKEGSKKKNVELNKKSKKIASGETKNKSTNSENSESSNSVLLTPSNSQHAKTHGKEIPCAEECVECEQSPMYPFNKVEQTESGHIIEKDDTPGSERLSVSHRTGTNFEIGPWGSFNATVSRDAWLSVYRDAHLHVDGYTHITLDKALKIVVNKDKIPNCPDKEVNFDLLVSGNANLNIVLEGGNVNVRIHDGDVNLLMEKGDVNIRQENGNYNHYVKGDYNLQVDGHMHTVVKGDVVNEIGGFRDTKVWGDFDHLEIEKGDHEIRINEGNQYNFVMGLKNENIGGGFEQRIDGGSYNLTIASSSNISIDPNDTAKSSSINDYNIYVESGSYNLYTAFKDINMYSGKRILLSSTESQNFYSNTTLDMYSIKNINVLSETGEIRETALKGIHLNGLRAKPSIEAEKVILEEVFIPLKASKWTPTKSRKRKCK